MLGARYPLFAVRRPSLVVLRLPSTAHPRSRRLIACCLVAIDRPHYSLVAALPDNHRCYLANCCCHLAAGRRRAWSPRAIADCRALSPSCRSPSPLCRPLSPPIVAHRRRLATYCCRLLLPHAVATWLLLPFAIVTSRHCLAARCRCETASSRRPLSPPVVAAQHRHLLLPSAVAAYSFPRCSMSLLAVAALSPHRPISPLPVALRPLS